MESKLYPFGFLFTDRDVKSVPGYFVNKKILGKYNYFTKDDVNKKIYEKNNSFILIHGEFLHIGIEDSIPENYLIQKMLDDYLNSYDDFLDTLDYIAGRYVIIIGDTNNVNIYPDATNSRSTYFIEDQICISSHAKLLDEVFSLGASNVIPNFHNTLFNTPFRNVKSVTPNFSTALPNGNVQRFFPRMNNKFKNMDEDLKFSLIEKFWKKQVSEVFSKSNNVILTITGGGDSRMSLALAREHIKDIDLVTYAFSDTNSVDDTDITSQVLSQDNIIVKDMVKELNLKHKFLYFVQNSTKLTQSENNIVKKNTIAIHSPFFIPFIKENFKINNLIHIRANLLEIGQAYYFRNYKESTLENLLKRFLYKNKSYITDDNREKVIMMFEDFISKTKYDNNTYDYHLLDLMYWEIHMGRWHAEIINTHDFIIETVSPFNHRALIDITLSFDYEKRKNRYFQYELINRNYPVLNFFGLNELKNLYEQTKNFD